MLEWIRGWAERAAWSRRARGYDHDTIRILRRLPRDAVCIDVGASEGTILRAMIAAAPRGRHHAFEPRPDAVARLKRGCPDAVVHAIALGDATGTEDFHHVVDLPDWSGLRRQIYPRGDLTVQRITVPIDRLDNRIAPDERVDFIKIDVEGAELLVLRGAEAVCRRWRPIIVFEYGVAGREQYDVPPATIFDLLGSFGLRVSLLRAWLRRRPALSIAEFELECSRHWYFVAHP